MADVLSPDERDAIDAAIAAGRVQRIPTGQSSFPGAVWNGLQLVDDDWQRCGHRPTLNAHARRLTVERMLQQGMTRMQIAAEMGITYHSVNATALVVNSPAWKMK